MFFNWCLVSYKLFTFTWKKYNIFDIVTFCYVVAWLPAFSVIEIEITGILIIVLSVYEINLVCIQGVMTMFRIFLVCIQFDSEVRHSRSFQFSPTFYVGLFPKYGIVATLNCSSSFSDGKWSNRAVWLHVRRKYKIQFKCTDWSRQYLFRW